jgi:hypothetical protein
MKRIIILLICISIIFTSAWAQSSKKSTLGNLWKYELEAVGIGSQGIYQVKVWSYMKSPDEVNELAMKNAVHGIIFKGFADKERIKGQKPLAQSPNLEVEKSEFFTEFFKTGGKYRKFVELVDHGTIAPGDRLRIGKEYKIALIVSVQVNQLRKDLEEAGVIKSLSDGF